MTRPPCHVCNGSGRVTPPQASTAEPCFICKGDGLKRFDDVADIVSANKVMGGHFFDPATRRGFKSRTLAGTHHGKKYVYFVTSEQFGDKPRHYSARAFNPTTGHISTASDVPPSRTAKLARALARRLAAEDK